jgi:hypothetical protein
MSYSLKSTVMEKDLRVLVKVNDRIIAGEIQRMLEESEIYSILESDNPASSVMNMYSGLKANETIRLIVNKDDYQKGVEIVNNSSFHDLLKVD